MSIPTSPLTKERYPLTVAGENEEYYSKFSGGVRNVGEDLETGHWGNNVPNVYERQILYANREGGRESHLGDITHYNHPAEWDVALAAESQLYPSIAHALIIHTPAGLRFWLQQLGSASSRGCP